jgi:hypothetical protein
MRYLLKARIGPGAKTALLRALENKSFGEGFPYGDLGEVLCRGRVDESGVIRWVEVCYCREFYGVAMHEELPYLEEYLTDIEVADARSPRDCKGYLEFSALSEPHRAGNRTQRKWSVHRGRAMARRALAIAEQASPGDDSRDVSYAMTLLATSLSEQGRYDDAQRRH